MNTTSYLWDQHVVDSIYTLIIHQPHNNKGAIFTLNYTIYKDCVYIKERINGLFHDQAPLLDHKTQAVNKNHCLLCLKLPLHKRENQKKLQAISQHRKLCRQIPKRILL